MCLFALLLYAEDVQYSEELTRWKIRKKRYLELYNNIQIYHLYFISLLWTREGEYLVPAVLEVTGRAAPSHLVSQRKSSMEGLSKGRLSCCSLTNWKKIKQKCPVRDTLLHLASCTLIAWIAAGLRRNDHLCVWLAMMAVITLFSSYSHDWEDYIFTLFSIYFFNKPLYGTRPIAYYQVSCCGEHLSIFGTIALMPIQKSNKEEFSIEKHPRQLFDQQYK